MVVVVLLFLLLLFVFLLFLLLLLFVFRGLLLKDKQKDKKNTQSGVERLMMEEELSVMSLKEKSGQHAAHCQVDVNLNTEQSFRILDFDFICVDSRSLPPQPLWAHQVQSLVLCQWPHSPVRLLLLLLLMLLPAHTQIHMEAWVTETRNTRSGVSHFCVRRKLKWA